MSETPNENGNEMPGGLPDWDMTAMAQAAVQFHEMFTAYIDAGFTPDQALALVMTTLTAMIKN